MCAGGRVMAEELDSGKVMVIKVFAQGHIFLRSFINSEMSPLHSFGEKEGIRCQQILK